MRNLVLGGVVALWGFAVVVNGLVLSRPEGGSYGSGQWLGIAIGAGLSALGVRTFLKALRDR